MRDKSPLLLVLATGGTIAGVSMGADDRVYQAAQLGVDQLLSSVPGVDELRIEAHQVLQLDSKDMDWSAWQQLVSALKQSLARDDVGAVVITHGTDTLEETAYLLHCLLDVRKPVVLTAAMRPATSAQADGPSNLRDALFLAKQACAQGWYGVVVAMAGRVWAGKDVRKVHSHDIDAFRGVGDAPLATITANTVHAAATSWPEPGGLGLDLLAGQRSPRVEVVTSHAGADGYLVDALLHYGRTAGAGLDDALAGLVVACTGNGTIEHALMAALVRAEECGVKILRSTRVPQGGVQAKESDRWPASGHLTPAQARVQLILDVLVSAHPAG